MSAGDPTRTRFSRAAGDRNTVIGVSGLLAEFNDAGVLDPLDVSSATAISRLVGEPDEGVRLAAALAVRGTRFGHVCIRLDTIRQAVVVDGQELESIESLPWPDPEPWLESVRSSPLVGDGAGDDPMVLVDGRLYLERYFRYEEQVAAMILARCGRAPRPLTPAMASMLDRLVSSTGGDRQRQAAEAALTGHITVIAGGPGTGKTHTVGAILSALAAEGEFPPVALCAPTGKAAARLGEAIANVAEAIDDESVRRRITAVQPSTIHRLLGWRPGRGQFVHDGGHRLPHDVVVVDEMSMVSLPMAARLLAAVRADASVILVGDPFQLESIEAGTVLTDIVSPGEEPAPASPMSGHIVVLDRVHRFDAGSAVADFAGAVRLGDAETALALLGAGHDALRWVPDRQAPGFAELWERVMERRAEAVRRSASPADPAAALAALNQVAVLCARRRGPDSVAKWGRDIEAELDQRFTGLRYGGEWYPGRPVMITSNDYRLDLFNGDIGVTVQTFEGLRVVFERGGVTRQHPLARLGEHSTVHAMTIHKSQGSQFDEVVVVLPDEASRLLTRELLYTAVTRAATRVWLVAGETVVRQAIGRSVERASGLGARLHG